MVQNKVARFLWPSVYIIIVNTVFTFTVSTESMKYLKARLVNYLHKA